MSGAFAFVTPVRMNRGRWHVCACYDEWTQSPDPEDPGKCIMRLGGTPSYWTVHDISHPSTKGERYKTEADAWVMADKLNAEDDDKMWHDALTPVQYRRLKRLQALGDTFWAIYGDGDRVKRWLAQGSHIGRWAVESWSERYMESYWDTYETPAKVEEEVATGDVSRIVDLDTGNEVSFSLTVTVEWP